MKSTTKPLHFTHSASSARPEWKLILACARARLDPVQRERIGNLLQGRLDWMDVVATSIEHCVESLLHRNLSGEFADAVPANAMQSLAEISRARSRKGLYLTGQMVSLLDRFKKEGVRAVPYKGPMQAALAYNNFALRYSEDLDFVLPQRDVMRAFQVLLASGFQGSLNPKVARDARLIAEGQIGQYCFFSERSNTMVELHTEKTLRYFPVPLDWEGLQRRLIPVAIGGRRFHTFSLEDTLLLLSVHGAKHFWNRLSWVCDIAAIMQAPHKVDWELSEHLARRAGCRRMWLLGLALATTILDAPLPAPAGRQIRGDTRVAALVRNVQTQLFRRDQTCPGALQRLIFRLRSHETWTQGFHQCLRMATRLTEEDYRAHKLPEWAVPLYPFFRPWLLLREYGLGLHPRRLPHLSRFEPTPLEIAEEMVRLAGVRRGDVLYDLGCGNGQIVVAAARRFGMRAVGVDIDPQRIAEARDNIRRNGVENLVELRQEDALMVDLSPATVVTMFLEIQGTMALVGKLHDELHPGARVVSRDFCIPAWPPDETKQFELSSHRTTFLYLWRIPERAAVVAPELGVSPAGEHT